MTVSFWRTVIVVAVAILYELRVAEVIFGRDGCGVDLDLAGCQRLMPAGLRYLGERVCARLKASEGVVAVGIGYCRDSRATCSRTLEVDSPACEADFPVVFLTVTVRIVKLHARDRAEL